MKIYKAKFTFDIVVLADSCDEAKKLAKDKIYMDIHDTVPEPTNITLELVENIKNIPKDWIDAIPYDQNGENKKTCFDLMISEHARCYQCKSVNDLLKTTKPKNLICKQCLLKSLIG